MLKDIKQKVTLACGIIVIVMMVVVIFSSNNEHVKKEPQVNSEKIISLLNKINNNYTLNIEENINNTITKYIYYNDSKLELYERENDTVGYIKYNNNIYSINPDDRKLNKVNELPFIEDRYYNVNFLKKIISMCDFKFKSINNVSCKIDRNDYFTKLNETYNTTYGNDSSDIINININYNNTLIDGIKIDYSLNNNIKIYYLEFVNVGTTDFSIIYDQYKNILD